MDWIQEVLHSGGSKNMKQRQQKEEMREEKVPETESWGCKIPEYPAH